MPSRKSGHANRKSMPEPTHTRSLMSQFEDDTLDAGSDVDFGALDPVFPVDRVGSGSSLDGGADATDGGGIATPYVTYGAPEVPAAHSPILARLSRQSRFEDSDRDADFGTLIPGLSDPEPEVEHVIADRPSRRSRRETAAKDVEFGSIAPLFAPQADRAVEKGTLAGSADSRSGHVRSPILTNPRITRPPLPPAELKSRAKRRSTPPSKVNSNSDREPEVERVGSTNIADDDLIEAPALTSPRSQVSTAVSQAEEVTGHVRSPVLARQPTRLEGLSRAVRSYVPSSISIAIPSAAPSPPRVSLPVSFGSFMTPSSPAQERVDRRRSWGTDADAKTLDEVLALDAHERPGSSRYPGSDNGEHITWASWDSLPLGYSSRRLLLVGYPSGLQIWDCTNLDSLVELLNLPSTDWGRVWSAAVLPSPSPTSNDRFQGARPAIGIVAKRPGQTPELIVYSLVTHSIVERLAVTGLVSFSANSNFIIISTSNPPTLRILSPCTLATLFIIPSLSLSAFARHSTTNNNNKDTTVLLTDAIDSEEAPPTHPRPVVAVSRRLLAFSSPPPRADFSNATPTSTQPRTRSPVRADTAGGLTQADIGNMAIRVGGNVLSGMRSLGELAFTAARTRMTGDTPADVHSPRTPSTFFSRSAPAASHPRDRRHSQTSSVGDAAHVGHGDEPDSIPSSPYPTATMTSAGSSRGHYVTVVDLSSLLLPNAGSRPRQPEVIAEFLASKKQPISSLQFSADGTSLMVVPEDGQTLKVYQIRPTSRAVRAARDTEPSAEADQRARAEEDAPWHMYDLRRGRTSAIVERHEWAPDGRWLAIGSRNRTVHVFATNPYGGKTEEQSHMKGRVFNYTELPLSTMLTPIVRLRAGAAPPADRRTAPLAFTFVPSDAHSLPKRLLPTPGVYSPSSSAPTSAHSSPTQEPLSPARLRRLTNYQDVLLFDPLDGSVSLRRCFVERRRLEHNLSVPSSVPRLGGTSISLPSRSSFGRPSVSPPVASRTKASGLSQMLEKPVDLVGHDSEVATWNVRRGHDWSVVTHAVPNVTNVTTRPEGKPNWLAHAELQTHSLSPFVLPRTIYLSHQFSFYELSGDYHGLIRRYQFEVPGAKVEVRKEVEISAYSAGMGETFVHGSLGTDVGRPSSFDEPLSSAMASDLEYPSSPTVIPMFPNGAPGSGPGSFKNTIPIQRMTAGISDGMSEGIGRLRREIGKVRSPRLVARPDQPTSGEPVTLEFDEEDEDFLLSYGPGQDDDAVSRSTSRDEGGSAASISTPSSGTDALDRHEQDGDGAWLGWEAEDRQAVEDAEQFHEISVVGFMDEEQAQMKRRRRAH